jgi:4,5-DOPA dioxygenase extradiol
MTESKLMPVFFIGHGSPMNAIETNEFSNVWKTLSTTIPTPRAILCVSAHWVTRHTAITSNENPPTIHDFGGFPKELFQVEYPAKGSPEIANQILSSLPDCPIKLDSSWGLDHGTWSILRHIYPNADIPVLQLSLQNTPEGLFHYKIGQQLKVLRSMGILIVGSGNLIHNLGLVDWSKMNAKNYGFDWAIRANDLFKNLILKDDTTSLINYESLGSDVRLAIPTPEHYLPFLYILGAKENSDQIEFFNDELVMGSLNMTSVRFG